jgi:hypothetical protein
MNYYPNKSFPADLVPHFVQYLFANPQLNIHDPKSRLMEN